MEKLQEFKDCAKYLLQNPITLKAVNWRWRDKQGNLINKLPLELLFFRDLHHLLARHIQENDGFTFSKDNFNKAYKDFERGMYSPYILHRLTAIMEGFAGDIEELNLGNTFKIRKMTEEEKNSVLNEIANAPPASFFILDVIDDDYILESIYSQAKDDLFNTAPVREVFNDIVTVLRLFKSGRVTARYIRSEPITWSLQSQRSNYWLDSRFVSIPHGVYKLNRSEEGSFLKLWRRFKIFKKTVSVLENANYINLALKRFNFGIEENDAENKIIDFFIAFEALCLPESEELKYRLSNRVTTLLAKNSEEAEKTRDFMKKAYDIRSSLVHGRKIKSVVIDGKTIDLDTFTQRLEEYLRQILKSFLALSGEYKKQEEIITLLDKSLFDLKTKRMVQSIAI